MVDISPAPQAQNSGQSVSIALGSSSQFSGPSGRQTLAAVQQALETVNQEVGQNLPSDRQVRTQLRIDNEAARVVAEVVDRRTGEVVDSFPPDLLLGFIARTREQLGPLVDFTA